MTDTVHCLLIWIRLHLWTACWWEPIHVGQLMDLALPASKTSVAAASYCRLLICKRYFPVSSLLGQSLLRQWRREKHSGLIDGLMHLSAIVDLSGLSMDCQRRLRITSSRQIWTHSLLCLLRMKGSLLDVFAQVPLNGRSTHLVTNGGDPLQCYLCTTRFFGQSWKSLCSWVKPSSPLRGDTTDSSTHALPIREVQTALVHPACPPAAIGQPGRFLTGLWLFHHLLPQVWSDLTDGGNPR